MNSLAIGPLTLFYESQDRDAAEHIAQACRTSIDLLFSLWGLDVPDDCRVYVMTSWKPFLLQASPWSWRIFIVLLWPYFAWRFSRAWALAAGWSLPFGKRRTVGIKPPLLLPPAEHALGDKLFVRAPNDMARIERTTCHELTHALSDHLRLPRWLHEGLAVVTVDHYADEPTMRPASLEYLEKAQFERDPAAHRRTRIRDQDALIYHYVRGYWLTRYLLDTQSDLMRAVLSRRYKHADLESEIAAAFGQDREQFWQTIDPVLVAHFGD